MANYVRTHGVGLTGSAHGLRIDDHDNIWITDVAAHTVLRLNQRGNVTMVLGRKDKPGETDALFNQPTDVAFGPSGEIFVTGTFFMADGYANRILQLDADGNILGVFGEPGKKPGQFLFAHSVAVSPDGALFISEILNWRVQKYLP